MHTKGNTHNGVATFNFLLASAVLKSFSAQEPAQYLLTVTMTYPVATPADFQCLQGYASLATTYFERMDAVLSRRCSASVEVFVRYLRAEFFAGPGEVRERKR